MDKRKIVNRIYIFNHYFTTERNSFAQNARLAAPSLRTASGQTRCIACEI